MFIQILIVKNSWIVPFGKRLARILMERKHQTKIIYSVNNIKKGDILLILGWRSILLQKILVKNRHNLVVHESALPRGKGWSSLAWQILEGKNKIPITLFEAGEKVDSGKIYFQDKMEFEGHELVDELRLRQGEKTIELVLKFIENYPKVKGRKQKGKESFYPRRTPKNSEININKTLKEQFNLLRVVDNKKYPAFFNYSGRKYILKIFKTEK